MQMSEEWALKRRNEWCEPIGKMIHCQIVRLVRYVMPNGRISPGTHRRRWSDLKSDNTYC